jgi:hypothetical protein
MLSHCKMILEHEPRKNCLNPDKFDKLITSLQTAVVTALRIVVDEHWIKKLHHTMTFSMHSD